MNVFVLKKYLKKSLLLSTLELFEDVKDAEARKAQVEAEGTYFCEVNSYHVFADGELTFADKNGEKP
jgi:hypothetical protein